MRDVWKCVKEKNARPQLARAAQGSHSKESKEPAPRLTGQLHCKDMICRIMEKLGYPCEGIQSLALFSCTSNLDGVLAD